jgi:serine protease Do
MKLLRPHDRLALCLRAAALLSVLGVVSFAEPDLDQELADAFQKAAARVTPGIVLIETAGGLERVDRVLKGEGPTTGTVISQDGYIATSTFNFGHKPASIFVVLPDGSRRQAKLVASDRTRLVTLLKVEANDLAVPTPSPKSGLRVGQWVLALGRGWSSETPAVSAGIISALNRVWGKAVQTDAKVSPANYGGPLVDLDGRVIGILVPLSPMAEGETAGFEWYDSGIGFAAPLEDFLEVLPRLREGKDLERGILGVQFQGSLFEPNLKVVRTAYKSPAAEAGILKDDQILALDDKPVRTQVDLRCLLAGKYAGDTVSLKVQRGDKELAVKCVLADKLRSYERPMLGILPSRKPDKEKGVVIRHVFPGSAAEAAKLQAGDRILKSNDRELGPSDFRGLAWQVWSAQPEETVKLEVARGKETLKTEAKLLPATADVPDRLEPETWVPEPEPAPKKAEEKDEKTKEAKEPPKKEDAEKKPETPAPASKDGEKKEEAEKKPEAPAPASKDGEEKEETDKAAEKKEPEKPKTGEIRKSLKSPERAYWAYVPANYDPRRPMALVVWLHPRGATIEDEVKAAWKKHAEERNICILGVLAGNTDPWGRTDENAVSAAIADLQAAYKIDGGRVVIHGHGEGAALAFKMAFAQRGRFRGVLVSELPRRGQVQPDAPPVPMSFLIPFVKDSRSASATGETVKALKDVFHAVVLREIPPPEKGYLPQEIVDLAARWLDSFERI